MTLKLRIFFFRRLKSLFNNKFESDMRVLKLTEDAKSPSRITRFLWTVAGTFFLVLGIIGIVLPLLPTTPFLLLAAACYLRGSERMHNLLINHKWFGEYIKNYQKGRGIPLGVKITSIAFLWITISISAFFFITWSWLRIILFVIALMVSLHILSIKTLKK